MLLQKQSSCLAAGKTYKMLCDNLLGAGIFKVLKVPLIS